MLAAIKRDSLRATEAGLKYFCSGRAVLRHVALWCFAHLRLSGSTNFAGIAKSFTAEDGILPLAQVVGMVFLLAGLAFKISAVPFHMWTPDVYEGAPTPMTAFFAAAPKLAGMAVFLRVVISAFPDASGRVAANHYFHFCRQHGAGGICGDRPNQYQAPDGLFFYRAYGFCAGGLCRRQRRWVAAVILYMTLYGIMTLGAFACILSMRRDSGMVEQIKSLSGLSQVRPFMALCLPY